PEAVKIGRDFWLLREEDINRRPLRDLLLAFQIGLVLARKAQMVLLSGRPIRIVLLPRDLNADIFDVLVPLAAALLRFRRIKNGTIVERHIETIVAVKANRPHSFADRNDCPFMAVNRDGSIHKSSLGKREGRLWPPL